MLDRDVGIDNTGLMSTPAGICAVMPMMQTTGHSGNDGDIDDGHEDRRSRNRSGRTRRRPVKLYRTALAGVLTLLLTTTCGRSQPLPPEAVACSISGYSIATDRAGAAVRAEPDASAKILGRLAPPRKARTIDNEDVPPSDQLWRTEFQVVGFREGWFLVEKALHPYDDPNRRGVLGRRSTGGVKTYSGRGWISLKDVGGKYTFHHRGLPDGALYSEPRAEAVRQPAKNGRGDPIQGGNSPKRVLGCDGDWVRVESHDGVVGWWKGLCGQPIGDCDKP